MKLKIAAAVLAPMITLAPAAHAQDAVAGEMVFKRCLPCHAVGPDAKNQVGSMLNGLEGRTAGTVPGYNYSKAIKNSGIVWNEATFKEYIKERPHGTAPSHPAKVKGTKMYFYGVKKDGDIENLWAYLKQFGPNGQQK